MAQDSIAWKKPNVLKGLSSKRDSVFNKLDSVKQAKLDSIKLLGKVGSMKHKVDSLKELASNKAQSASNRLDSVAGAVNAKLDSLKNKATGTISGIQTDMENKLAASQEKLSTLQGKATDQGKEITTLNLPGNEGKELTDALGLDKVNIPKTELPKVDVPELNMPSTKMPDADLNLPEAKINQPNAPLPTATGLGNGNLTLPQVENPLESITEKVKDVKSVTGEVGQYANDVKQIKEKGLSGVDTEHLEKEAFQLTGASEADKKMAELKKLKLEQEQMLQKYQDKKLVQAELKRKMKNVVNDQINLDNPAIRTAQEQFSKSMAAVEKAKAAKGIISRKNREENEWKDKSLKERLVPGLGFQISRNNVFSLDLDPQLGYQLSNRFVVGVGGHYRFNISKQYNSFVQQGGVYGGRVYMDFKAIRSFYLHAEFEGLTLDKDIVPTRSEKDRPMVYGSHLGLGKQFNVSKRISVMMYGFYRLEYSGHLPGFSKYNTRLVFSLKPKRPKVSESKK